MYEKFCNKLHNPSSFAWETKFKCGWSFIFSSFFSTRLFFYNDFWNWIREKLLDKVSRRLLSWNFLYIYHRAAGFLCKWQKTFPFLKLLHWSFFFSGNWSGLMLLFFIQLKKNLLVKKISWGCAENNTPISLRYNKTLHYLKVRFVNNSFKPLSNDPWNMIELRSSITQSTWSMKKHSRRKFHRKHSKL